MSLPGIAAEKGTKSMGSQENCQSDALARSICIITAILADVKATYTLTGGGGITTIQQDSTDTFTVSISQEERKDLLTYEVEVQSDGTVAIKKRTTGTITRGG